MSTRTSPRAPRVLLAGGGSGGHVFPALAVGEELVGRGADIHFAGSPTGMEAELVPSRGVRFHPLRARPFVGQGPVGRVAAVATMARSALAARTLVRREGIDITLGTGGYASVPATVGTRLAGRPVVLLEPNADAGAANRLASRLAVGACVAAGARPRLHCPQWETGVPVRRSFQGTITALPEGTLRILVLGGSQGSAELNRCVPTAVAAADPERRVAVRHQCGRGHAPAAVAAWAAAGHHAEVTEFIDDVAAAMRESHLVISRAGAITLAELAAVGRGAVLVPLMAAGAHQLGNARERERLGAAIVVEGGAGLPERLATSLTSVFSDPALPGTLATRAAALARPDAAARIADHLLEAVSARWATREAA